MPERDDKETFLQHHTSRRRSRWSLAETPRTSQFPKRYRNVRFRDTNCKSVEPTSAKRRDANPLPSWITPHPMGLVFQSDYWTLDPYSHQFYLILRRSNIFRHCSLLQLQNGTISDLEMESSYAYTLTPVIIDGPKGSKYRGAPLTGTFHTSEPGRELRDSRTTLRSEEPHV